MSRPRRSSSSSSDGLSPMRLSSTRTQVISDRNRRLLVLAVTAFFIVSVYLCSARLFNMSFHRAGEGHQHADTGVTGDENNEEEIKLTDADFPMSYGQYGRPSEEGLTLMRSLDAKLAPTATNGRRLIVIGDIHGMDVELEKILVEVEYNEATDHVITAGDMVNKGPDTPGVINHLMKIGASAVRGNHEDRLLLAKADVALQSGVSKDLADAWSEERTGVAEYLNVARKLTKEQIEWLEDLPVILTVEDLAMHVVHAGLVPGLHLKKQDPWAVMNMRTIVYPKKDLKKRDARNRDDENNGTAIEEGRTKVQEFVTSTPPPKHDQDDLDMFIDGNVDAEREVAIPVDGRNGNKWADEWDKYQLRLKKQHRRTVFYGHDAKQGYREGKYTFGLDSGCVRGEHLTALIVEVDPEGRLKTTKKQVKCKKYYS